MADAIRRAHQPLPEGLLAALAAEAPPAVCGRRIAVAREHAETRAFDDVVVVEEIASQLLLLSV